MTEQPRSDIPRRDRESQGMGPDTTGHAHETIGAGPRPPRHDQETVMERLESRIGEEGGVGSLGQGTHVGTPAGGSAQAAETGSAHWGSTRTAAEDDAEADEEVPPD